MKDLKYVKVKLLKIDHVDIKDSTFIGWSKPATFIDSEFGEWNAKVSNVVGKRRTNHPLRSNLLRKKKNIETNSLLEVKEKRKATKCCQIMYSQCQQALAQDKKSMLYIP